MEKKKKKSVVTRYNKWGYIFLIPFFIVFIIFQAIPLINTIYNSFFENYMSGLKHIGPTFVGLKNYAELFNTGDLPTYFANTMIMWVLGFVPQIVISLILSFWFSSPSLRIKGQRFFKTVIYLPNLIMASAFAMLFFTLFSDSGPINSMLIKQGLMNSSEPFKWLSHIWSTRGLVAFMNFIMWFGNTTILLMAGMMGIPADLYEAAEVDGCKPTQIFWKITMPLLKPIFIYVLITSLIGGLQMFDVPQILTNGSGDPMRSSMTLIMYLNKHLFSKNYGMAGALSVILLVITGILSFVVFRLTAKDDVK